MKKILCTICMRGNSKGLVNKNLKLLNGKPLMFYTVNQAKNQKFLMRLLFQVTPKNFEYSEIL